MDKSITMNNAKMHYTIHGKGKCIVLIHGYGATGKIWDQIIPMIDNDWQVMIPELPGSGISDVVESASIKIYADMIHSILQQEKISACVIIGHSMGGYVAMEFAKHYSAELLGVGLLHSHVFADDTEKKEGRKKSADFIQQNGAEKYLKEFASKLFSENTPSDIAEAHLQSIMPTPAEGLIADLYAMAGRDDTSQVLKELSVPVFFGFGEKDAIMLLDVVLKQTKIPAKFQVEIFANSGHMSMMEEPENCAEAINNFLQLCTVNKVE